MNNHFIFDFLGDQKKNIAGSGIMPIKLGLRIQKIILSILLP